MEKLPLSQVSEDTVTADFQGAAQGIGAEAVEIFVNAGAKVIFADVNVAGGKSIEKRMSGYLRFVCFIDRIKESDLPRVRHLLLALSFETI